MEEKFRPFRHRIAILKKVESQDTFGEITVEWQQFATIWGEIHGDTVTTRYLPEVEPGWRVRIGKTEYSIEAVVDRQGRTRLVELHLKEIPGRGGHARGATAVNSRA